MLPRHPSHEAARSAESRSEFVNRLFDRGAPHYDTINGWGFFHTGSQYRRDALARHGLRPGHKLLDVACGTGLVAVEAMKILGSAENITCLDPSEGMLSVARAKLPARFVVGRAEHIPFPDASFDFLTMGYALRHVSTLEEAFREYHRVLTPGGKVLILEITKPANPLAKFLFRIYFGGIFPFLTKLFTGSGDAREMVRYYWETMEASAPPERVLEAMRNVGLSQVKRNRCWGLLSEYSGVKA